VKINVIFIAAITFTGASSTMAFGHHSFAMFEREKQITLNGAVKEFQWTNPHSWIVVTVPASNGKSEDWAIEGGSPLALSHNGWTRDTLKPGDHVTLVTKPLKNGDHGGSFVSITLSDGRTLGERAP
jgi:hypothetical protein